MAFGITPQHIQETTIPDLTQDQILAISLETVNRLQWSIGFTSENGFSAYTRTSWSSWGEIVTVKIEGNKVQLKSVCTGGQIVDWGKNRHNIESFLASFEKMRGLLSSEDLSSKILEVKSSTTTTEGSLNQPLQGSDDRIRNVFSLFIPTEGYFITPILVVLNLLVFVAMVVNGVHVFSPDTESLLNWGANFRPLTLEGQWWRLVTSCFLHIGLLHLLMNMYALVYIGLLLEPQVGKLRFLTAYLLSGIGGSVASLYWHEMTISAGASGAIFGMYGVFLAMLTTNLIEKSARKALLTSISVFVVYNLINGLTGGIDNAAHIGGLLVGMVNGYAFYPSLIRPKEVKINYLILTALSLGILLISFLVYKQTPNDFATYQEKMEKFANYEILALEVYQELGDWSNREKLDDIEERGIYYWKECIKVLKSADKLSLPDGLHRQNKKLLNYCELRIKSYQLIYKSIDEQTDKYQEEIQIIDKQIEVIIAELSKSQ